MSSQRTLVIVFVSLNLLTVVMGLQMQDSQPESDALVNRTQVIEGSLFYPLPIPCSLFSLEGTTQGEPMALMARGDDLSQQGGSASGCGIPDDATALMIQLRVESPSGTVVRIKLWQTDRPKPSEELFDAPFGLLDTTMIIVPLNQRVQLDPIPKNCTSFKVRIFCEKVCRNYSF